MSNQMTDKEVMVLTRKRLAQALMESFFAHKFEPDDVLRRLELICLLADMEQNECSQDGTWAARQ